MVTPPELKVAVTELAAPGLAAEAAEGATRAVTSITAQAAKQARNVAVHIILAIPSKPVMESTSRRPDTEKARPISLVRDIIGCHAESFTP